MILAKSKVEPLLQPSGLEGVYKQIELCGRTCYKSEDKITEDSAKGFVDRMIESNHTAMLEHGTIYLSIDSFQNQEYPDIRDFYSNNPYSRMTTVGDYYIRGAVNTYITTNFRVLVENNRLNDLKYICKPTKYHEKRYTFKIITDRSVSHELVRHRTFSFAQESQRYCGYDKDKFGGELTFIMPEWYATCKYDSYAMNEFDRCLNDIENLYLWLRDKELSPQEARAILPNCTKTEIIMTGFASDWKHFLDLRYFEKTGKVQPEMKRVATQIFNLLNEYT